MNSSTAVEINFAEHDGRAQFRCQSDGSNQDSSFEEKSDSPPSPRGVPPQEGSKRFASPKKGIARSVYDEIKKSLKRVPSAGKDSEKRPSSLSRTFNDANDFFEDDDNAGEKSSMMTDKPFMSNPSGSTVRLAKHSSKPLPAPPPVALKRPAMDSDEENSTEDALHLVKPQSASTQPPPRPMQRTGSTSSATSSGKADSLPFRARTQPAPQATPARTEDLKVSRKTSTEKIVEEQPPKRVPAKATSSGSTVATNRPGNVSHGQTYSTPIRPPAHSDDCPMVDSQMIDESILRKMDNDVSAIPPPTDTASGLGDSINGSDGNEEQDDTVLGSHKSNWITSKLDDTLYGKVLATKWSCAQVSEFLEACGLGLYVRNFAENGVDGPTLMELSHDQVRRGLQVHERLHLLSLEMGVDCLRQRKMRSVKDWEWSCSRVSEWLEAKGLSVLVNSFKTGAIHGGVLFALNEDQFVSELGVGRDSVLILLSLLACIERARVIGPLKSGEEVPDWSPSRVKVWLETLSLGHLAPIFKQYAVNGALLLYLDAQLMRTEMGVTEIQALVLEKAVMKLRRRQMHRTSFWGVAWKRLSSFFRSPMSAKGENPNSAGKARGNTASRLATEFGQGTFQSLAATYGKYTTKGKNRGTHQRKQNFRALQDELRPGKAPSIVSQQPVSPAPSRPPRPTNDARSKAKHAVTRQNGQRFEKAGQQGSLRGGIKDETTNTMSIL